MNSSFKDTFFRRAKDDFNALALEVFRYQAVSCDPYRRFLEGLSMGVEEVEHWRDIPHLPIEAFKNHQVVSGAFHPEQIFTSSGTTGQQPSRHFVAQSSWYQKVFTQSFDFAFGSPNNFKWLCLLPSYLEREGSSLIEMAQAFISESNHAGSGFFLNDTGRLLDELRKSNEDGTPTILLGVSFALLDLAEQFPMELAPHIWLMETGGMKGRRKELIRSELHQILMDAFRVSEVYSEYGMTEMMSQAYSKGRGIYELPPWVKVKFRDPADPLEQVPRGKTGGLDIVDLANLDSCAFLATQDLGKERSETTFEVLGRFDQSDIRGCNLMTL